MLVLCSEDLEPLSLVNCYPIGVARMFDSDEADDKIIAIPFQDPTCDFTASCMSFHRTSPRKSNISSRVYKTLEGRTTAGFEIHGREVAVKIIAEAIDLYKKIFGE